MCAFATFVNCLGALRPDIRFELHACSSIWSCNFKALKLKTNCLTESPPPMMKVLKILGLIVNDMRRQQGYR